MLLVSPSFKNGEFIPAKFTCDGSISTSSEYVEGLTAGGGDINPELNIESVPENAKSLALIVDDPDAPAGTFTHWLVWNINPKTTTIKEESVPPGAIEGKTDFGRIGYGGPCPPPGKPHRYFFKLYALDRELNLPEGASKRDLESAIKGHIITSAELTGVYKR